VKLKFIAPVRDKAPKSETKSLALASRIILGNNVPETASVFENAIENGIFFNRRRKFFS
jgi:hypothetical protein